MPDIDDLFEIGDLVRLREIVLGPNLRGIWLVVATRAFGMEKIFTLQKGHKRVTCPKMYLLKV